MQPVPDQPADVELVVEDAGTAGPVPADGGVAPENAARTGQVLVVEAAGDRLRRAARGELRQDAADDGRFIGIDRASATLVARDDVVARSRARRRCGRPARGPRAYAVRSNRTDPIALERFCAHFNYEPMVFDACDADGTDHTNVLMCIATDFVMIGLDMMVDDARRDHVVHCFEEFGRKVIALTAAQITDFAGNAIEKGRAVCSHCRPGRCSR